MLAAIGIPVGLILGILGTFVVFNVAGEGIGMLIDQEAFAGTGLSTITVNPAILAICALLALVTVLISAAIPAWRASRVSAVDAIRSSRDVRLSRRERRQRRRAARGTGDALPFTHRLDNMCLRLTGVPGILARRNLTRASSKGRVAVASLAVSVALIIISGGISHYLSYLTEVVDSGGSDIEVSLNRLLEDDETTADGIRAIDAAYRSLKGVSGVRGEGYLINTSLYGSFQPGMIDTDALTSNSDQYEMPDRGVAPDGTTYAPISLLFLDKGSWSRILEENGLDRDRYTDPEHPVAVGLNGTQSNDGKRYSVRDLFQATGKARLFTNIEQRHPIQRREALLGARPLPGDREGTAVHQHRGDGREQLHRDRRRRGRPSRRALRGLRRRARCPI